MDKTVYPFQGITPISILKDMSKVGSRQMDCRRSHGFIIKLHGCTHNNIAVLLLALER